MIEVELTAEDAICASAVATIQMVRRAHKRSRQTHDHGATSRRDEKTRWAHGLMGYMAEIAVSKALNLAWTTGGMEISKRDVGERLEVRSTDHSAGHALVYSNDADDALIVFVTGSYPLFQLIGYCRAGAAKQSKWWRDDVDTPCWWVPQEVLGNAADLRRV